MRLPPSLRRLLRPAVHAFFRRFPGPHPAAAQRQALAGRYLAGQGLEIGALHLPLPVPSGAHVRYVDWRGAEASRRHYPELRRQALVQVDVVDDGERLQQFADASQDFVIANHFLEHCQDPVGTMLHHLRVLRPGGVLFYAVPDGRYTFDRGRPLTTLEHIVHDHKNGPAASRQGHFEEFFAHQGLTGSALTERVQQALAGNEETHYHVWTAGTFGPVVDYLEQIAPVQCECLISSDPEFVCVLRKTLSAHRGQ